MFEKQKKEKKTSVDNFEHDVLLVNTAARGRAAEKRGEQNSGRARLMEFACVTSRCLPSWTLLPDGDLAWAASKFRLYSTAVRMCPAGAAVSGGRGCSQWKRSLYEK